MKTALPGSVSLLLLLLGGSCTSIPDTSAPGHTFDRSTEDGVTVARSSAIPKYEGELFRYEPWFVLREDQREESLLIRPEPGTLDERGHLYVPDSSPSDWPSVSRIAVFDSAGIFQFAFGQPGQGPGDMWHPQINYVQDGVLETYDLVGQRRLTRYRTDGGLLEVETLPAPPETFRTAHCYRTPDGRFLRIMSRTEAGDGPLTRMYRAVMYGAQWDSLWSVDGEEVVEALRISFTWQQARNDAIGSILVNIPFGPRSQYAYHPRTGLLFTTGQEPVLDIYGLDGHHRLRILADQPSEPVTAADRAAFEAPIEENLETATGIDRDWQKAELENLVYPEYKTHWGETLDGTVEIDDAGYIWVRIPVFVGSQDEQNEVIRCHVFSPEGEYLGITRLPTGSRRGMTKLTRGCLVVVEKDPETDAKTVVVYRIGAAVAEMPVAMVNFR